MYFSRKTEISSINGKQPGFSMSPTLPEHKYTSQHSSPEAFRRACLQTPQLQSSVFASLDETLLARAEALAAVDIVVAQSKSLAFKADASYLAMNSVPFSSNSTIPLAHSNHCHHHHHRKVVPPDPMDHICSSSQTLMTSRHEGAGGGGTGASGGLISTLTHPHMLGLSQISHHPSIMSVPRTHHKLIPRDEGSEQSTAVLHDNRLSTVSDAYIEPAELEAFVERFKQRRIKLGVTQADVGATLTNLKIPGVGCLSQSTICRFESLTLSHNNMKALKPILQAWLEEAEGAQREKMIKPGISTGVVNKRKRTSIAAPEKRSLEAYFLVQPRPSSEKIAAIAENLELQKNVVRVWFCNQRQKEKRLKFSAAH